MLNISGNKERPKKVEKKTGDDWFESYNFDMEPIYPIGDFHIGIYEPMTHRTHLSEELMRLREYDALRAASLVVAMNDEKKMSRVWVILVLVSMFLSFICLITFNSIAIIPSIAMMLGTIQFIFSRENYKKYQSMLQATRDRWSYLDFVR